MKRTSTNVEFMVDVYTSRVTPCRPWDMALGPSKQIRQAAVSLHVSKGP